MRCVVIGVQARSDSKRLPNKVHLQIGNRAILKVVLDSCTQAIKYLRHESERLGSQVKLVILTAKGDPIVDIYKNMVQVIEGDHDDVLSRYVTAAELLGADYMVRITADCLWIPSHLIAKHIKSALIKEKAYTTNIHYRTHREGFDCEVISKALLAWLDKNAKTREDREHVTTLIAADKPFPFKDGDGKKSICHILSEIDESRLKTSIDTREEYDAAKAQYDRFKLLRDESRRNGITVV